MLSKIEDPERFLEKVKYLYTHKHETSRDEIKFRDGTVLDRYSSPVFGNDDHYYGRIWTFRDMTARKKNEDALRQLSVAVEQSPVSVVIADLKGDITYVNRRFTECTGYSYEEARGKNPRLLKSGHTSGEEYRQLWQAITRGEEWRGELRNRKKNGDLYWESAVISPIRNSAGETSHYLAVKEDITEQKLAESHSRQAQKLEAIGQLAAGIAHEINTPIQFIGDNIRFIKEAWPSLDSVISLCESAQGDTAPPDLLQQVRRILEDCDSGYLRSEIPRALVDDDSNVLDGYRRSLSREFSIETAAGPGQALPLIEKGGPYAVIVSDMSMPGMSGIQLLSAAKSISPDTVRIILTGNADTETAINAINEGNTFRFLVKPCALVRSWRKP